MLGLPSRTTEQRHGEPRKGNLQVDMQVKRKTLGRSGTVGEVDPSSDATAESQGRGGELTLMMRCVGCAEGKERSGNSLRLI